MINWNCNSKHNSAYATMKTYGECGAEGRIDVPHPVTILPNMLKFFPPGSLPPYKYNRIPIPPSNPRRHYAVMNQNENLMSITSLTRNSCRR